MERMKQPVPVLGINRAETDLTVKDGRYTTCVMTRALGAMSKRFGVSGL